MIQECRGCPLGMECAIVDYVIQSAIAIGTVGTLIAALFQIRRESKFRAEEKKKMQAVNVAAWLENVKLIEEIPGNQYNAYRTALIRNNNLTPIYDVVLTIVDLHGAGPAIHGENNGGEFGFRVLFSQVPTGLWGTWIDTGGEGMGVICALEVAFRDGAGVSWIRRGNGELIEIDKDPLTYYSVPLPASWGHIERISLR